MYCGVSVCLCIPATAKPIGFSFTVKLHIGPRKVYNYLVEGITFILKEIISRKNYPLPPKKMEN